MLFLDSAFERGGVKVVNKVMLHMLSSHAKGLNRDFHCAPSQFCVLW